jgi:hypothetical protein
MRIQTSFLAAAIFAALMCPAARASLVVNLRFANGSTTHQLTAADVGTDIEIDVWASITGQNPPSANNFFGIQYVYYNVVSSLPNGGGTGVNGAIDASANSLVAPFNANGSQLGVTQDINGDGVADVGSATEATNVDKPRGFDSITDAIFDDNATAVKNALPDGYEFEIEKLFFHVNSLALGETEFTPVIPTSLLAGADLVGADWFQDSSTDTSNPPPAIGFMNGPYSGGTAVTFVNVPEPTGIAMLLGVGGLLGWRRGRGV